MKLSTERALDWLLKEHPTIAALSADQQSRADLQNLAPTSPGYVYIMMDSGASLNTAKLSKHFPMAKLLPSEGQRKGEFAQTATGERLYNNGQFRVCGYVDGHPVNLGFVNMDVDIPAVSVRQFISSGHDVHFLEGGGFVQHRDSGAKIRFMELGGVYFLKMKLHECYDGGHVDSGFARPAP